jgi:hypothetical protein
MKERLSGGISIPVKYGKNAYTSFVSADQDQPGAALLQEAIVILSLCLENSFVAVFRNSGRACARFCRRITGPAMPDR